jgi:hypothetical protein
MAQNELRGATASGERPARAASFQAGNTREHTTPPAQGAMAFADALLSGKVGRELTSDLFDRFPSIARYDIYVAIGLASTVWEVDIVLAEGELERIRQGRPLG